MMCDLTVVGPVSMQAGDVFGFVNMHCLVQNTSSIVTFLFYRGILKTTAQVDLLCAKYFFLCTDYWSPAKRLSRPMSSVTL